MRTELPNLREVWDWRSVLLADPAPLRWQAHEAFRFVQHMLPRLLREIEELRGQEKTVVGE